MALEKLMPLLALAAIVSAAYLKPLSPFDGVIISDQLPGMDSNCLRCLCSDKVGSNCNKPIVCTTPDTEFCDLMYFDNDYWIAAGRPVRAGDNAANIDAFINCRRNIDCAARTVLAYLEVHRNVTGDCNDDKVIDCMDYASVHFYGVDHCSTQVMQGYRKNELQQCLCSSGPRGSKKCGHIMYANHQESAQKPHILETTSSLTPAAAP